MELKSLVTELYDAIRDDIDKAVKQHETTSRTIVYTDAYRIVADCFDEDERTIIKCYKIGSDTPICPNVTKFLYRKMNFYNFWADAYDCVPRTNPNPGVDPAFASIADFYNMVF